MKVRLKENPREWRKSVLFVTFGLALIASLLAARQILSVLVWLEILGLLLFISALAMFRPRWFRGWYRFSIRVGTAVAHFFAQVVLVILFIVVVTPLGLLLRASGKDLLRLKRGREATSYWTESKEIGPLDRMF